MTKLAIVYYSGYGHTDVQANAVAEGARGVEGAEVELLKLSEDGELDAAAWAALDAADAIVYGSPTYMGAPAWQFKKFADASSKPWFTQNWKDKIAGGFTTSATANGDKFSTIQYFITLSQQHGQLWCGVGLMPANTKADGPEKMNWTGGYSGLLAIAPSDSSPEEYPTGGDLDTARSYGQRLVETAKRWNS